MGHPLPALAWPLPELHNMACFHVYFYMHGCNSDRIICSLMALELPDLDDEWPESGHGDTWHCPRPCASSPLIGTPAVVNQENQHLFVKNLGWEIPPPAIRFRRLPRILAPRTSAVCNLTLLHWPRHCVTFISILKQNSLQMIYKSAGCFISWLTKPPSPFWMLNLISWIDCQDIRTTILIKYYSTA